MSWQEIQFHSSGLSEENVMKGLLGEVGVGEGENRGWQASRDQPEQKAIITFRAEGPGEGEFFPRIH